MEKMTPVLTPSQQIQCQILIKSHPLFEHLPLDVTFELASLFSFTEYQAGDIIVREDDDVDSIFFILKGTALVSRSFTQFDSTHITTLKSGETIGLSETGFYSLTLKRSATVTAKSPMKLLCLQIKKFDAYLAAHAEFAHTIYANSQLLLRIRFINELREFANLNSASVLYVASKIIEIEAAANEFIFHENDESDYCYLLRKGRIELFTQHQNEIKILGTLSAPAILGETSFFLSEKRDISAKTLEECLLLKIDKKTLITALDDNPSVAKKINELMEKRKKIRGDFFRITKSGWMAC